MARRLIHHYTYTGLHVKMSLIRFIQKALKEICKQADTKEYKKLFDFSGEIDDEWRLIKIINMSEYKRYGFIFTNLDKKTSYDVQIFGTMEKEPNKGNVMDLENGWYNMRSVDWEGAYPSIYYDHTDSMSVNGNKSSAYWGSIPVQHIAIYTRGYGKKKINVKISGCICE